MPAQQIFVDIGNSRIKFAWHCSCPPDDPAQERCASDLLKNRCCSSQSAKTFSLPDVPADLTEWFVCSVNQDSVNLLQAKIAETRPADRVQVLRNVDLPIRSKVDFANQVGMDRLCAGLAAHGRCPQTPAIYIDSGTAVTINVIDQRGDFLGGVIFPGISTSLRSLRENTTALPHVKFDTPPAENLIVGKNTVEAITNGVFWSNIGAVESIVARITRLMNDAPQVFVTGGFGKHLCRQNSHWHWTPHLVLEGVAIAARSSA